MPCRLSRSSACSRMRAQVGAAQVASARRARTSRTAGRPRSPACRRRAARRTPRSAAMRMPLVLTIRCWIGRALARSRMAKKSGWIVGSPPEICTTSGSPSLRDDGVEHALDLVERAEVRAMGAADGVADRAAQVAGVGDLDQRQARVLLVVGAQAAVVRAAPLHRRVVAQRHLRRLDEHLAAAAVVVDVVGDQHALGAVLRAALEHVDAAVLEDDLARRPCGSRSSRSRSRRRRRGTAGRPSAMVCFGVSALAFARRGLALSKRRSIHRAIAQMMPTTKARTPPVKTIAPTAERAVASAAGRLRD